MQVQTNSITISTRGHTDIIDITSQVATVLKQSGLKNGLLTVFIAGATAAVTTIEYEPGLLQDLPAVLEKIAPEQQRYFHDQTWGDGNGAAHIRAALIGASFTVPFSQGRLLLGTWQQIVVLDFDNRPRVREIIVQMMGTTEFLLAAE